jgi:hypothetical protein
MIIHVDINDSGMTYLDSCARIRKIAVSHLLAGIIKTVCEEQLVLAVLDDDSKPQPNKTGTRRGYYRRRKVTSKL